MIPSPWTYATMHKAYRPLLIYQWQAQGLIYLQRIPKKQQQLFYWKNTY